MVEASQRWDWEKQMLQGPAPIGPGGAPRQRLAAFVDAYIRHMIENIDLVLLAERTTPGGRLGRQVYPFWRRHVEILLSEIGTSETRFRAESIMAVLAAAQLHHWKVAQGWNTEFLVAAAQCAVDRLATTHE